MPYGSRARTDLEMSSIGPAGIGPPRLGRQAHVWLAGRQVTQGRALGSGGASAERREYRPPGRTQRPCTVWGGTRLGRAGGQPVGGQAESPGLPHAIRGYGAPERRVSRRRPPWITALSYALDELLGSSWSCVGW
jgi:hypothetical protein